MRRTRQLLGFVFAAVVLAAAVAVLREEPSQEAVEPARRAASAPAKKAAPAPVEAARLATAPEPTLPLSLPEPAPAGVIALADGPTADLGRLRAIAADRGASQEARLTAVWELGQTKDPAAWETLAALLRSDEDPAIRAQVLCSITPGWDEPNVVRAVVEVVARDQDSSVRVAAAYYLGEAKSEPVSASRALLEASRAAKETSEAESIALALGRRSEPAAQDELLRLLSTPGTPETVRASAAEGLMEQGLGKPELADRIDPLLASETSPAVKKALGKAKGIARGEMAEAHDHAEELPALGDGTLLARMADDPAAIGEARQALEAALADGPPHEELARVLAELTEAERSPAARERLQREIKTRLTRNGSGTEEGSSR